MRTGSRALGSVSATSAALASEDFAVAVIRDHGDAKRLQ